LVRADK